VVLTLEKFNFAEWLWWCILYKSN